MSEFGLGNWLYGRGPYKKGVPRRFGDHKFGFVHAHKGGFPVLRGEASWRTINGIYGNAFGGFVIIEFRRHWRK